MREDCYGKPELALRMCIEERVREMGIKSLDLGTLRKRNTIMELIALEEFYEWVKAEKFWYRLTHGLPLHDWEYKEKEAKEKR